MPHADGGTWGRIGLDVRNLPAVAAIHAAIGECENRMVEDVVGVEAELGLDAFSDGEILRQSHVIVEGMRAAIGINSDIADLAATRQHERTGNRPPRCKNRPAFAGDQAAIGKRRNRVNHKVAPVEWVRPVESEPVALSGRHGPASVRLPHSLILGVHGRPVP